MSIKSAGLRYVGKGALLMGELPRHPQWSIDRIRGSIEHQLLSGFHKNRVPEYESHTRPFHEALVYVTNRSENEVLSASGGLFGNMPVRVLDGEGYHRGPIPISYDASSDLAQVVYTVCKLLRPSTVVETGVARGVTTSAILANMEENETGHLYSVERPGLSLGYAKHVGELVPQHLRSRWSLVIGLSARVLPRLLRQLGSIGVFVHDSAHDYRNQKMEYQIALKHMMSGGVLVSDDVNNDAFIEVAESMNCRWSIIGQSKSCPIGVLSKVPSGTS
jgi:predicted O-methyltransferase YrrM